jgi:hypothetical protein
MNSPAFADEMAPLQRAIAETQDLLIRRGAVLAALNLQSGERVARVIKPFVVSRLSVSEKEAKEWFDEFAKLEECRSSFFCLTPVSKRGSEGGLNVALSVLIKAKPAVADSYCALQAVLASSRRSVDTLIDDLWRIW